MGGLQPSGGGGLFGLICAYNNRRDARTKPQEHPEFSQSPPNLQSRYLYQRFRGKQHTKTSRRLHGAARPPPQKQKQTNKQKHETNKQTNKQTHKQTNNGQHIPRFHFKPTRRHSTYKIPGEHEPHMRPGMGALLPGASFSCVTARNDTLILEERRSAPDVRPNNLYNMYQAAGVFLCAITWCLLACTSNFSAGTSLCG